MQHQRQQPLLSWNVSKGSKSRRRGWYWEQERLVIKKELWHLLALEQERAAAEEEAIILVEAKKEVH